MADLLWLVALPLTFVNPDCVLVAVTVTDDGAG